MSYSTSGEFIASGSSHDAESTVSPAFITKGKIVQIYKSQNKQAAIDYLRNHLLTNTSEQPSMRQIRHILDSIIKTHQKHSKNQGRTDYEQQYQQFLSEPVNPPKSHQTSQPPLSDATQASQNTSKWLDASLKITCESLGQELAAEKSSNENLKSRLDEVISVNDNLQKELKKINRMLKKKKIRNSHLLLLNKQLKKTNKFLKENQEHKRIHLKQSASRERYFKEKIQKLSKKLDSLSSSTTAQEEQISALTEELIKGKEEIVEKMKTSKELAEENDWLRDIVQDHSTLTTFSDGKYIPALQKCIFEMLENRVSARNVSKIITCVLKFAGHTMSHTPSTSTINNMNIQRLLLAQKQLGDEFASQPNTTLLSDETTKFATKMEGIHATDMTGRTWVLGMREIQTKSSSDVMNTLNEILKDVDERSKVTESEHSRSILVNISARLSDRAATELKFGELLQEAKKELLPIVREGFSEMSAEDQNVAGRIFVFACGLHGLVHIAECCSSALREAEKGLFSGNTPAADPSMCQVNEPGTVRLVRTACKSFARGADAKSGCHLMFNAYVKPFLRDKNLFSIPLTPFRGNRFNILFTNAGHVYFLAKQMTEYLSTNATNRLLKSVLHDLKCPELLAGCKALGLISKFITTPLWRVIEDKSLHILDMSSKYQQLVDCLQKASAAPADFMNGDVLPFGEDTIVKRDCIYTHLLAPSEYDSQVETILSVLLPAMTKLCMQLYADHLSGGIHDGGDKMSRLQTASTPKHNKFSESVFATVDYLMTSKPNISVLASEAYVMFANNRTLNWLESKDPKDAEKLLAAARRETPQVVKVFQERHKKIQEARHAALLEKQRKAEEARAKKLQELQQFTDDIVHHGLWQSSTEVGNMIKSYSTSAQKLAALKSQLRFRQHVLKQPNPEGVDTNCYAFSMKSGSKRRQLTPDEIVENLKKLCEAAAKLPQQNTDTLWVGRRIRHRFAETDVNGQSVHKWFHGKVISQVTITCNVKHKIYVIQQNDQIILVSNTYK